MKTAPRSANTNDGQWIVDRSTNASDVPTSTGVTAAASVFGRAARSQGFTAALRAAFSVVGYRLSEAFRQRAKRKQPTTDNTRSGSWKPWKLLEIGLPLFHVRVPPFLRFLGQVVEQRGVAAEVEEAELAVAVGVHCGFEETQRHRGEGEHLAAPFQRLFLELCERHDRVDEAHFQRLLRVVLAAEEPDLARFFLADD